MLGHATWLLRCLNSGGGTLPLMPIWEVESTSLLLFSQKIRPIAWSAGDLELQYKWLRFIFTLTLVARCVSLAPSHSPLSHSCHSSQPHGPTKPSHRGYAIPTLSVPFHRCGSRGLGTLRNMYWASG